MGFWETTNFWVTFVSRFFTIGASGIAIWGFCFKRTELTNAFNALVNYTTRISISDLLEKVRQLNQYSKPNDNPEITNKEELLDLLASISGHVQGNKYLKPSLRDEVNQINRYLRDPETLTKLKNREIANRLEQKLLTLDTEYFNKKNDQ